MWSPHTHTLPDFTASSSTQWAEANGLQRGLRGGRVSGASKARKEGKRASSKAEAVVKVGAGGDVDPWKYSQKAGKSILHQCYCYSGLWLSGMLSGEPSRWNTCGLLAGKTEKFLKWPSKFPCLFIPHNSALKTLWLERKTMVLSSLWSPSSHPHADGAFLYLQFHNLVLSERKFCRHQTLTCCMYGSIFHIHWWSLHE